MFDFFKSAPAEAPAAPAQTTGGGQPATNADPNSPAVPAQGSGAPANPLDAFSKLFDNREDNSATAPTFALDSDTVQKAASSLNFTDGVDQVVMQKAQEGDTGALLQVMNSIAQQAYATGLQHTAALTDKYVQSRSEFDALALPEQVRGVLTKQELSSTNVPNHPVIQAQLSTTAKQIAAQYPDASPAWVADQAKNYVIELANALNPKQLTAAEKGSEGTDWDDYFKS